MRIKAFIFDLDGVLTDTAKYHYLAWKSLAERLNLKFDIQDNERLKGVSRLESLNIILEINGMQDAFSPEEKKALADEKNDEYRKLIRRIRPTDILPGVGELLRMAEEAGIKTAVASASRNAGTVLSGLELYDRFDYVSDAAKIRRAKPYPDVFSDCAVHLAVQPESCIGFEDSQAGIEAIHSAGMFAVGIGVHVTSERPDLELADTKELNIRRILEAAGEREIRLNSAKMIC